MPCRCVPKAWVRESKQQPWKVWDDSGTGGAAGSFWVVNAHGCMVVSANHSAPQGPFYEVIARMLLQC